MIVILSVRDDPSTEDVISWLRYFKVDFIRINPDDLIKLEKFEMDGQGDKIVLKIGHHQVDLNQVKAYWYRRGDLTCFDLSSLDETPLIPYLRKELVILESFLHNKLERKFHINKRKDNEINKLQSLSLARAAGLKIPPSDVVYETSDITQENQKITKAFRDGGFKIESRHTVGAKTELVQEESNTCFPSFVQKLIPKRFELRIFYLLGEFYATAIFSQQNSKTRIDFRNYDRQKPNRIVPFELPGDLRNAIDLFMQSAGLNCGSLDFIYGTDGQFYFLEVNPIGQFQQVSTPGNYYLDKRIAEKLLNHG